MQKTTTQNASGGHHGHSQHQHRKKDSTSEFRNYMLNRGRRRRRMENFLFGTLVCVAVLLGLFLVSVYLLGI